MDGTWRIYVCILILPYICCLTKWEMQNYCGQTIGQDEYAGDITFDSAYLAGDECQLIITPKQTKDADGLVLFYFTDFQLGQNCSETNVKIQEVNTMTILGLPDTICGQNSTLINLLLTTRYSQLVVTFQQSKQIESGPLSIPSMFHLKFASFHEGKCGDSDIRCSNGRCVDKSLKCRNDIKPCGDTSPHCPEKTWREKLGAWWERNLKWFGLAVGVLWAFILLSWVRTSCKRRHRSCSARFWLTKCGYGSRDVTPTRSSCSISLSSPETTNPATSVDTPQVELEMSDSVSVPSTIVGNSPTSVEEDDFSMRWSALAPAATSADQFNDARTSAPPSYDKVVATDAIWRPG